MKNFTAADAAELPNVRLVSHPLIEHKLAILRDASTPTFQFRMLVDEISHLMIFEATRDLALKDVSVQTPVAQAQAKKLATKVMICPILRAALGMLESVFKIIPNASVGFLGFQRNEKTAQAEFFYAKLPADAGERVAIVIDPMFATGGTAIDAVKFLREKGVKRIKFISVIAAPEGLKRFSEIYPDVSVYTAAIDERLNEKNYIVPGLGDAGDRVFNTL
ncbi:uracil phosphoribosyltransferase [uncultured Campylobacter sp.]|uniref:uracil phosphoribosyltransferase n=1 Tax=uncultured Campylobacter sp. TaxID=218934 RepID=UPI002630D0D9|nr:uracil phosphoribosyltransferase [uncultured Campylobacter sp.]